MIKGTYVTATINSCSFVRPLPLNIPKTINVAFPLTEKPFNSLRDKQVPVITYVIAMININNTVIFFFLAKELAFNIHLELLQSFHIEVSVFKPLL